MNSIPTLEELLLYKNPGVIKRFKINHPRYASQADQLFTDMLCYLWLCEKHSYDVKSDPIAPNLQFTPVMHEEMRIIDAMWHEFILITRDYHAFCHHYFGHFLHHEPNMNEELAYSESEFINSLNLFLSYSYDVLGEPVIKRWFGEHL